MIKKDPVVRISTETDLILTSLKHQALIKEGKRVYKNQILDFMVAHCPNMPVFQNDFWKWVRNQGKE